MHENLCVIVTPLIGNRVIAEQIESLGVKHVVLWEVMKWIFHLNPYIPNDYALSEILAGNIKFKDKYKGKRCFIVGTGPSLKEQDLSVLKNKLVFTVNSGFKLKDFEALNTDFHVYVDSMYFQELGSEEDNRNYSELMKRIGKKAQCFFPYQKSHAL